MNKLNIDREMNELLQNDIKIPDIVNERLEISYEKIQNGEVHMKRLRPQQRKKGFYKALTIAAAAACFVLILSGILYANPALARDIPILGNVFGRLQEMREKTPYSEKDKTAYKNIEQHSKPLKQEADFITTAQDQGITMSVSEAYCDGVDLYFTLSLRTDDAVLNTADSIDLLSYRKDDPIAFWSWLEINGEEVYPYTTISAKKSEEGVYVGLLRVSALNLKAEVFPENMTVTLNAGGMGAHKYNEIPDPNIPNYARTGFKTVDGSWKLRFQPSIDASDNQTTELYAENNGVIVQKVVKTPTSTHVTVYLPGSFAAKNPALALSDGAGNRLYQETAKFFPQANGGQIQQAVFNYTEASDFTLRVYDKNAKMEEGAEMPPLLAEIPFSSN